MSQEVNVFIFMVILFNLLWVVIKLHRNSGKPGPPDIFQGMFILAAVIVLLLFIILWAGIFWL